MRKYLNQVHSFKKLASGMQNVFALLDRQILMTRQLSSILPKMQACKMKIGTARFFSAKARLAPAKTWKDVLHSQENRRKECIEAASDITFACYNIAGQDLGTTSINCYVHVDVPTWLGSLVRWLPMNHPGPSRIPRTSEYSI